MPTIPTYDSLHVAATTTPQARFSAVGVQDTAGREAQQMGAAMQQAGGELARLMREEQDKADQIKVADAMNQAVAEKLRLTYDKADGYTNLRGDAALTRPDKRSLDDEYTDKLGKRLSEIEAGLGNDRQKQAFRMQSGGMSAQFRAGISQHVAKEYQQYQDNVFDGTQKVAVDNMGMNWDNPGEIRVATDAIKASVYQQGKLRGYSAQQIEANTRQALTKGHAAVLASAIDAERYDYATEYLKANKDEIDTDVRLRVTRALDAGSKEARSQEITDALMARHKGDIEAALADARATLSGKDEDAVVQRLKAMDAERVTLRERGQRDAADQAWKIYASTGNWRKVPRSVLEAMDGKDIEQLREAQRRAVEHARGKVDTEARDMVFYGLYGDDAAVAGMRPEQIIDMRRQGFTGSQVGQLLRRKEALEKEAESVAIDSTQLRDAFARQGVKKKPDQDMIAAAVESEVYQEQQRLGRKLDRAEKEKIIQRQFLDMDVRMVGTGFFNKGDVSYTRKQYWEVGDKRAASVPADIRKKIIAEASANGVRQRRDERILERYLAGKQRGEW